MRRDGDVVYISDDDAATLRQIAGEFGLTVDEARRLLELDGQGRDDDEMLRPRVAAVYRLVLDSVRS